MDIVYLVSIFFGIFFFSSIPAIIILKSYFRISDEEIISSSFGFSFFVLSTISFLAYILKQNPHLLSSIFVIGVGILSYIVAKIKKVDISFYFKKEIFILYFLYLVFTISLQFLYPVYLGGGWYGDWYEHYERARFFLHHYPINYKFLHNMYSLPARTPLFNLTASFYLSLFGDSFSVYQIVSTLLNTVFLLGVYSLVKEIKNKKIFYITFAIIILSTFFTRMSTFTFTKSLTAYYIILGIYFYIKFNKFSETKYLYLCSMFFAFAYLTHQYTISYILPIFLHMFFKRNVYNLIIFSVTITILLLPWHIFSIYNFSLRETIFATPAFAYEGKRDIQSWIYQRYLNLQGAFLPVIFIKFVLSESLIKILKDKFLLLSLYDRLLNFYTGAIPATITLSGSIFWVYYILTKGVYFKKLFTYPYSLFLLITLFGFLGDILLVNTAGVPLGMAQNGMMPMCLILVIFLSGIISNMRKIGIYLIFAGMYIEYVLTSFLFFYLLNSRILEDGNINLVLNYQLVFLKDYLNINWKFTMLWTAALQLIILKILFLKYFKK